MFFLVLVVQMSDVLQYVWGKLRRQAADRAGGQPEQDLGRIGRRRRVARPRSAPRSGGRRRSRPASPR